MPKKFKNDTSMNLSLIMGIYFLKFQIKVHVSYFDYEYNTDNAWKEVVVLNYHDETGEFFNKDPLCTTGIFCLFL
jgi:hypothetical protein